MSIMMAIYVILGLVVLATVVCWKIFAKAGYGGWLGILALIPGANLLAISLLAFTEWPVITELKQLRAQANRDWIEGERPSGSGSRA